jgi:hypothetical protein
MGRIERITSIVTRYQYTLLMEEAKESVIDHQPTTSHIGEIRNDDGTSDCVNKASLTLTWTASAINSTLNSQAYHQLKI